MGPGAFFSHLETRLVTRPLKRLDRAMAIRRGEYDYLLPTFAGEALRDGAAGGVTSFDDQGDFAGAHGLSSLGRSGSGVAEVGPQVRVVDSGTAAMGLGFPALAASLPVIVDNLKEMKKSGHKKFVKEEDELGFFGIANFWQLFEQFRQKPQ